jgi:predicted nucleotidyltransferase component of viral defense system
MGTDLEKWVASAPPDYSAQYKAMHIVIHAIASSPQLSPNMIMKGGVLLGIYYGSPRYTNDIDFSTATKYDPSLKKALIADLNAALIDAVEHLGYNIDCRVQGVKEKPNPKGTYITVEIGIGYAEFGSGDHKRLVRGQSSQVVRIDYSYNEVTCQTNNVRVGENETLPAYAITDVVAEKFRALLQQASVTRNFTKSRPNDIFDIHYLIKKLSFTPQDRTLILKALLEKCQGRNVDARQDSFGHPIIRELAGRDYPNLKDEVVGDLPPFEEAFDTVHKFYGNLPWSHQEKHML